jgi:hypothetical protein
MVQPAIHDPKPVARQAPADAENPALIDAEKLFKIILMSAVLFVLAALFVILRTRLG